MDFKKAHFSSVPQIPITFFAFLFFAIWPATLPVAPAAPLTTTTSEPSPFRWPFTFIPIAAIERCITWGFLRITYFLEQILMEHVDMKGSLDSKLQIDSVCPIRIPSRNWDIFENGRKTYQSNPSCQKRPKTLTPFRPCPPLPALQLGQLGILGNSLGDNIRPMASFLELLFRLGIWMSATFLLRQYMMKLLFLLAAMRLNWFLFYL